MSEKRTEHHIDKIRICVKNANYRLDIYLCNSQTTSVPLLVDRFKDSRESWIQPWHQYIRQSLPSCRAALKNFQLIFCKHVFHSNINGVSKFNHWKNFIYWNKSIEHQCIIIEIYYRSQTQFKQCTACLKQCFLRRCVIFLTLNMLPSGNFLPMDKKYDIFCFDQHQSQW